MSSGSLTVQTFTRFPRACARATKSGSSRTRTRSGPTTRTPSKSRPFAHRPSCFSIRKVRSSPGSSRPSRFTAARSKEITRTGLPGASQRNAAQHLGQPQLDPRTAGIRVLGLDLQAHRDVVGAGLPHHLEELLQRDQLALRRSGLVHPSAAEVQALELRDGHLDRAAAGRGGAVDVQIVQADQLVVGAEVDVALQAERDLSLCATRRSPRRTRPGSSRAGDPRIRDGPRSHDDPHLLFG